MIYKNASRRMGGKEYSYRTIFVRPETRQEELFLQAIEKAMRLGTIYSEGYIWAEFTADIRREGECKGCKYAHRPDDYITCRECKRNPHAHDNFRLPRRGPSIVDMVLKGLSGKKKKKKGAK